MEEHEENETRAPWYAVESKKLIAKKDFLIVQNSHRYEIKKGDDISDIPAKFHENLKTENVL